MRGGAYVAAEIDVLSASGRPLDGVTVVVSPLIALMHDQVEALWELGVPAAYLNSTVDYHTYVDTVEAVRDGRIKENHLLLFADDLVLLLELGLDDVQNLLIADHGAALPGKCRFAPIGTPRSILAPKRLIKKYRRPAARA